MKGSRFYQIWADMKRRCRNTNATGYSNYGGRGITVCDRWEPFENFRDDMYESYLAHASEHGERNTTIERKDINSPYSTDNCTWATKSEQNRNKSNVIDAIGVYRTRNGTWRACIDRQGQRHRKTFPTKEQALKWREQKLTEVPLDVAA